MSVKKGDRSESKVEFDNTYFKIYDDAVRLINIQFGANDNIKNNYSLYIRVNCEEVLKTISEIGRNIRIANSIYPQFKSEYEERRIAQDKAIGLCYDLLTKYQLIMHTLGAKDNQYVNETKNLIHEINCLKKWRKSDKKRFENLG